MHFNVHIYYETEITGKIWLKNNIMLLLTFILIEKSFEMMKISVWKKDKIFSQLHVLVSEICSDLESG